VRVRHHRKPLLALLILAPALTGCGGGASMSDMFQSDLLSKDAEWFQRPGRLFIRNVSIDAPPLTPNAPIKPDDLVTAEGACPGMPPPGGPPADANALADGAAGAPPQAAPPPAPTGTVALGHTECDVVRGIGAPDNVNLSNGPGGGRVAVVTWLHGPRAGIYTFRAGRLAEIERGPDVEPPPKPVKQKPKKKKIAPAPT
jgi:hypothetical protein